MKALDRVRERRRRKAHQRYLDERARQKQLSARTPKRRSAGRAGLGAAQQGMYGTGPSALPRR